MYVLECEPDAAGRPYRYVGSSCNSERRNAEHRGVNAGGAAWYNIHKPNSVIEIRVCENKEEAAVIEVMVTHNHQTHTG